MSLIEPDIKLEDLNFIQDKVIESKEDPSFDLVSELRLASEKNSTTSDAIKFKTLCSLLADLAEVNWSIEITRKGFDVSPPTKIKSNEAKIEAVKINTKAAETDINNYEDAKFLNKLINPPVGSKYFSINKLVDDGNELKKLFEKINKIKHEDEKIVELKKIINPEIQHCFEDESCSITGLRLLDIWRYFRLTWSMPYQSSNARTMPFLVRNAARPNKPVIGIFQLVNPFFNNKGRNSFLKWDSYISAIQEIKNKNLSPKELGEAFLKSIQEALKETRYDDFFTDKEILKPNDRIIKKLVELEKKYRTEELKEEKHYYIKKIPIKTKKESDTPKLRSEEKLYLKKRSKRLSKLLFARKIFNETNLKNDPKRALTIMIQTDSGKRAMNIALEYIRQRIYSTQSADLNVCGAVAPYNEIIGGKLITLLSTSKKVMEKYDENYKKEVSIISSGVAGRNIIKPSKLLFLSVSSLYDIASSQYNRLKLLKKNFSRLKSDLIWHEAGFTEGLGSFHISQATSNLFDELTKKVKKFKNESVSGKGTSHKIRKISMGLTILKIKPDLILMHNQRRRNYVFYHQKEKDMIKFLYGLKKIKNFNYCSSEYAITEVWMKRWLTNRIKRKETLLKLSNLNSAYISKKFEKIINNNPLIVDNNLSLFAN